MQVSDGIKHWLSIASEEQLQAKLEEYGTERRDLSPRDVETRARLANAVRAELGRRLGARFPVSAGS